MKRLMLMAAMAFGLAACGGEAGVDGGVELDVMEDGTIVSTI